MANIKKFQHPYRLSLRYINDVVDRERGFNTHPDVCIPLLTYVDYYSQQNSPPQLLCVVVSCCE